VTACEPAGQGVLHPCRAADTPAGWRCCWLWVRAGHAAAGGPWEARYDRGVSANARCPDNLGRGHRPRRDKTRNSPPGPRVLAGGCRSPPRPRRRWPASGPARRRWRPRGYAPAGRRAGGTR